jgi:acyl carrier protein
MVPSAFVSLEQLPLTPNGKLDRRALPAPEFSEAARGQQYVAPCSETEAVVAEIWSEVLRVGRVGVGDNFFELGGHSLLATQVVAQVNRRLGIELPLRELFEYPTVERLAAQVAARLGEGGRRETLPLRRVERGERVALSFAQQRLWFLDQLEPGSAAYNIPVAVRLRGELNVEALERAFNEVVRRHEVLRTTFANEEGEARQVVHEAEVFALPLTDLSGLQETEREQQTRQLVKAEALRPFDLGQDRCCEWGCYGWEQPSTWCK